MDNAAYHKRVEGLKDRISKLWKSNLIEWMKKCNPILSDDMFVSKTKKEIYNICRQEPRRFCGITKVEEIAKRFNIHIGWLLPYHPMLNPIEITWGLTKHHVADINDGKNFQKVKTYIHEGFSKITKDVWRKLVQHTYKNENELIEKHRIITQRKLTDTVAEKSVAMFQYYIVFWL